MDQVPWERTHREMTVNTTLAAARRTTDGSRRELLATTGVVASALLSGCSDLVSSDGPDGEGDTIEIMVENRTVEPAVVGIRVEDDEGGALFSGVYDLEPGHLDSSGGIEATPATVTAFTPEGDSATWEYAPDLNLDCDGEDVGITLLEDGSIDSWYAC